MNNELYISPFRDFKGHIQVLKHGDLFLVTISTDKEILMVSNQDPPEYINNRDNQWDRKTLLSIQTSSEDNGTAVVNE